MCQTIVVRVLFAAFAVFSLMTTALAAPPTKPSAADCATGMAKIEPMFKRSDKMVRVSEEGEPEPEYIGLTEAGIKKLVDAGESLRQSQQLLTYRNFEMENFIDALRIAQTAQTNMFVYGGGGGGKTNLFRKAIPSELLFKKQLHPMMNEMALIGGQTELGMKEGREDLNTKNTMIDATYVLLDEGEKAPPQLQALLLGLLNEKVIEIQGKEIPAEKLRTVIYTGNSGLPDFLMAFMLGGGGANTGAPFLNRFALKLRFPNWLTESENRITLMDRRVEERRLKALFDEDPRAKEALVFQKPSHPDFPSIEKFAQRAFSISNDLKSTLDAFVADLRETTHSKIRALESDETSKQTNPFGLVPAADFTTRLYAALVDIIQTSVAIDFLKSGMATPEGIKRMTEKPIELGKLSIWRLWWVMTTIGPSRTIFDPFRREVHFSAKTNKQGDLVPFDWPAAIESAKNAKEQNELKEIQAEQERFIQTLKNHWKDMDNANEELAELMSADLLDIDNFKVDFEFQLAKAGGTNVIKLPEPEGQAAAAPAPQPLTSGSGNSSFVAPTRKTTGPAPKIAAKSKAVKAAAPVKKAAAGKGNSRKTR